MAATTQPKGRKTPRHRAVRGFAVVVVIALALLAVGITVGAYRGGFRTQGQHLFGSVNLEVFESNGLGDEANAKASPTPIGRSYQVRTTGDEPVYVRVRLRVLDDDGNQLDPAYVSLSASTGGSTGWVSGASDGWYYYQGPEDGSPILGTGGDYATDTTTPLPVSVVFWGNADGTTDGKDFHVEVLAQAVQAKGQARYLVEQDGQDSSEVGEYEPVDSVLQVHGWPAEEE